MNRTRIITAAALSLTAAGLLLAGPLNPPAGPVTSTYKTLTEVEPRIAINLTNTPGDADSLFKITQRGSYYLTGNITGVALKHGIEITASGVTLDLSGFELAGITGMGSFDGVTVSLINLKAIAVKNGTVRGWGGRGIDLNSTSGSSIRSIHARANVSTGIDVGGSGSVVTDCSSNENLVGFSIGISSTIIGCTANANTTSGFITSFGATIINCTAYSNDGDGFSLAIGSSIIDSVARANSLNGIRLSTQCVARGNVCTLNTLSGILANGTSARIEGNHCAANGTGIRVSTSNCFIVRNTCSENTTNNWNIDLGNHYGPIIDRTAVNPPSVIGNSAPDSLGSTHPNANFTL